MGIVLIVDNEPVLRLLLSELLADEARGHVVAVGSITEAEQALRGRTLDVALVERDLPDGSGLDLTRRLKAADAMSEVVLMSAFPTSESVLDAIEAGAGGYLAKPFEDIQEVAVRITNAEEKVRLRREHKKLHKALRESEGRYRGLFEASPDAILVYSEASGIIRSANDAASSIYGYDGDELIGSRMAMLRGQNEVSSPKPSVGPQKRRDRRKNGSRVDVEVTKGRFGVRGQPMVVEVARDVSERIRAEDDRHTLEEKLRRAQKLEAVGTLAGGIAHDFNNLLAVIMSYAGILVSTLQDPEEDVDLLLMREDAEQILQAANSAALVTRQLLSFSRREVTTPEVLAPNTVIHAIEKILRRTIGERVTLVTELADDAGYIRVDGGQLEQVIVNLAVNARDAMPSGGTLTMRTLRRKHARGELHFVLEVEDSGVGMSKTVMDRIFEPFFTTKESGKGTGLGLATVKGIVEAASGDLEVKSEVGVGTTVVVALPLVVAPVAQKSAPNTTYKCKALPGELVLLVEDDDGVRGATRRILRQAGFEVVEARTGAEAIDKVRNSEARIDLLLTDVVMPGMSGDVVAAEVKALRPGVGIVFMTGYATNEFRSSASAERVVLPKPFRDERLLETLREVIDGSHGPERARLVAGGASG